MMPWKNEQSFYFWVVMLLLLIMALRTPLDTDMWWHLRAGEETWVSRQVYARDDFSYTRQGESWTNHSWLSQVLIYLMYRSGGYLALTLWVGLSAVASMALVYHQMQGHALARGALLILGGAVASVVWTPRPQLMSLVLFGLVGWLLHHYKWNGRNYLPWLVPVFLLWGNLHAGYVLGMILIGVFIAGEVLNRFFPGSQERILGWSEIRSLFLWACICWLVVLVNPFGLGMWKIPFDTVGVESLQDLISEWASPDFHQVFQQPLLWLVFLVFLALGRSQRKIDFVDLLALVAFSWLAFTARRNFGPLAMIAVPLISRHLDLSFLGEKLRIGDSSRALPPGLRSAINLTLLALLAAAAVWKAGNVSRTDFIEEQARRIFPVQAVQLLEADYPSGRIFNEYDWGGYIIWNLRDFKVFVDGRTDLFGDEIITDWSDIINAEAGWEAELAAREVDYLLLRADRPLARVLGAGWERLDGGQGVFLARLRK